MTLTKLVNDILWRTEKQEITALMVTDLSAAFNTVGHKVLIEVLRNKLQITRVTLEWYKAYFIQEGVRLKSETPS